jgi:hypothetical protein
MWNLMNDSNLNNKIIHFKKRLFQPIYFLCDKNSTEGIRNNIVLFFLSIHII